MVDTQTLTAPVKILTEGKLCGEHCLFLHTPYMGDGYCVLFSRELRHQVVDDPHNARLICDEWYQFDRCKDCLEAVPLPPLPPYRVLPAKVNVVVQGDNDHHCHRTCCFFVDLHEDGTATGAYCHLYEECLKQCHFYTEDGEVQIYYHRRDKCREDTEAMEED
jgi:hypothetical protein